MKKTYFAPVTDVVKVELQQMVAASPQNVTLSTTDTQIEEESAIGSRSFSVWGDDED